MAMLSRQNKCQNNHQHDCGHPRKEEEKQNKNTTQNDCTDKDELALPSVLIVIKTKTKNLLKFVKKIQ